MKLSDSVHSAYVSVSNNEDIDLIFSDKIRPGQFVYVSRFDLGSPVPVVCGLKVLPKRRPCIGSSKYLLSSDLLQIRPPAPLPLVCSFIKKQHSFHNHNHGNKVSKNAKTNKSLPFDDSKTKLRKDYKLGNRKASEFLELRRFEIELGEKRMGSFSDPKKELDFQAKCRQVFA